MVLEPRTENDERFGTPGAAPNPWSDAVKILEQAEIFWITTVRADGRPHLVPLIAIWLEDAMHFCTGAREQKAKNLEANAHCIMHTGTNQMSEGLDIVIEGVAERVTDASLLQRLADAWAEKYTEEWRFEVGDGGFRHAEDQGQPTPVFRVAPVQAFGFGRGTDATQTRWRF